MGWRCGLTAEVQTVFEPDTSADLCLIDTDSRAAPLDSAVRRMAQIARRLLARPPAFVFKKVDSLLRGAVLAETRALARALGRQRVLLISANPSRGRVIRDGKYFVDGVPLDETIFAADPAHPRLTSDVRALLESPSVGRLSSQVEAGLSDIHVAAPDVASGEELEQWARQIDPDTLPAGAADFFAAILSQRLARTAAPVITEGAASDVPHSHRRTLVVCGSATAWPVRHTEARGARLPCIPAPVEVFAVDRRDDVLRAWGDRIADALETRHCVVVGLGRHTPGGSDVAVDGPSAVVDSASGASTAPGAALARRLAEAVSQALRRVPVERLLLEGGATAAAVVRAQGWTRLDVIGAPGAGVAELRPTAMAHGTSPSILVKPGSYPWPARVWESVVADCVGAAGPASA